MSNRLQTGAAWLGGQLQSHAGRTVSIIQGAKTIGSVVASLAKYEHNAADAEGFFTTYQSDDWTFVAADLPSGFEFRAGTVIAEGDSKWEALPLGQKPCVERLDSSGILLTVHTKRVS